MNDIETLHQRAEDLLAGEKRLLEMIARGGVLAVTLGAICRLAEEVDPGSKVSILLLDAKGERFRHGAAPSLPASYASALPGYPVGLGIGPCAAAAYLREQVVSLDMSADLRWPEGFRSLVSAHELKTCWSTPIMSSEGRVLGTFAIYPGEPATPTPRQRSLIEQLTHVASIAIERSESTDALRRSEERYARAMEAAEEGHWESNMVTDQIFLSARMKQMMGFSFEEQFLSRADYYRLQQVHPDDRQRLMEVRAAAISGAIPRYEIEYRILPRPGEVRWVRSRGKLFRDPEGRPLLVSGSITDVTDRHLAEEDLRRMERQLRQAQRLESMGTLAGGIAHDFNNLLGAILGYGEMALRDAPAGSRLRRDVESIMIAGERGRALVDRILAFSRSGVGERVAVHVEAVAGETLALFTAKLPSGIRVDRRLNAGGAAVMGDPTQIHQVLMNLITNAVHAMPVGGTLRVSLHRLSVREPRVATTGAITARDYVVLEVADTGSGIRPEILEKIFDPFFTTKEVGVGTGLGLSLVHGIVTGLGGAIDVVTAVGAGSVFKVYLPFAGELSVLGKSSRRMAPKRRRVVRGRVLVVDDEGALVRLATETLTNLGYSTVGFTAGPPALEAFMADPEQFDVVITDESMPGTSGSQLIRKMRAIRPTLPVLLVSGYLSSAVAARARQAGASELLKKPLSTSELAQAVDRVLRAARGRSKHGLAAAAPSPRPKTRRQVSPQSRTRAARR